MAIVVLMTCANEDEAQSIVEKLLDQKLIACANLTQPVRSLFWWEGKVNSEQEILVVMKTREECFVDLKTLIKSFHSYSVPEIIALPIVAGNEEYLNWIDESTGKGKSE